MEKIYGNHLVFFAGIMEAELVWPRTTDRLAYIFNFSYTGKIWLLPMVSSKVIALILREAKMASLSARVGSSFEGTLADRITHISQRLTLTALKSALLRGDPLSTEIFGRFCSVFHSRRM